LSARKNSNLPRLEPEADMKQNGTWKKIETEANQVKNPGLQSGLEQEVNQV